MGRGVPRSQEAISSSNAPRRARRCGIQIALLGTPKACCTHRERDAWSGASRRGRQARGCFQSLTSWLEGATTGMRPAWCTRRRRNAETHAPLDEATGYRDPVGRGRRGPDSGSAPNRFLGALDCAVAGWRFVASLRGPAATTNPPKSPHRPVELLPTWLPLTCFSCVTSCSSLRLGAISKKTSTAGWGQRLGLR
jgi:hypothetical protein